MSTLRGGVHFSIDEEFERNRAATISSLTGPRYANVLDQFENAYTQLAETPPNGKNAIRAVFAAPGRPLQVDVPGSAAPQRFGSRQILVINHATPLFHRSDCPQICGKGHYIVQGVGSTPCTSTDMRAARKMSRSHHLLSPSISSAWALPIYDGLPRLTPRHKNDERAAQDRPPGTLDDSSAPNVQVPDGSPT